MELMEAKPTIYVITHHEFSHGKIRSHPRPLDSRFLDSDKNFIYYLIDREIPSILKEKNCLQEPVMDPLLYEAGGKYFGEWSFLLAEEKHAFCNYPFFMISSRFYEKNKWLYRSLNEEWDSLFAYLAQYGWGYLPSYDRPLRWIPLDWRKNLKEEIWRHEFFPLKEAFFKVVEEMYYLHIPNDYPVTADLFCNYIGFQSRQELLQYVNFYRPFIDYFFDEHFRPKRDLGQYAISTGKILNEKPFTFMLEWICHLFFHKNRKKYFALHYDGYYEVDERERILKKLDRFPISSKVKLLRWLEWQNVRFGKAKRFIRWRGSVLKRILRTALYERT